MFNNGYSCENTFGKFSMDSEVKFKCQLVLISFRGKWSTETGLGQVDDDQGTTDRGQRSIDVMEETEGGNEWGIGEGRVVGLLQKL